MINILNSNPQYDNICLFPNLKINLPYQSIFASWDRARQIASLPNCKMHDLRHSSASFLVDNGRSLYEVQKILGHSQIKTTQHYAHLTEAALRDATNTVDELVRDAISGSN